MYTFVMHFLGGKTCAPSRVGYRIALAGWDGGRRKRKYFYSRTGAEVQEQLLKARSDHSNGLPVAIERQTVAQFLDHWLKCIKANVAPLKSQQYSQHARLYLNPVLGRFQLSKARRATSARLC